MNNQSSLLPQGSLLEQKNKGRARVKVAVFFVLAVHCIGLLALLVQGCRKDSTSATAQNENTNNAATPPTLDPSNATALATDTNPTPQTPTATPAPIAQQPQANTAASDYTVASGDNFHAIAKKFQVTVRAIMDANPGVEPTKLRVGQKIHIPAATAAATPTAQPANPVASNTGSGDMYTVKSGDTLSTIARLHSTTVKAIRAANSLTTDRIKVGDKLKLPKGAAPVTTAANDTTPPGPTVPQAH
jgi:LysM repeat protein